MFRGSILIVPWIQTNDESCLPSTLSLHGICVHKVFSWKQFERELKTDSIQRFVAPSSTWAHKIHHTDSRYPSLRSNSRYHHWDTPGMYHHSSPWISGITIPLQLASAGWAAFLLPRAWLISFAFVFLRSWLETHIRAFVSAFLKRESNIEGVCPREICLWLMRKKCDS